jgi:hypothetical protein
VWSGAPHRATKDLDLLGFGEHSNSTLVQTFQEICTIDTVVDGLRFDNKSVTAEPIREDNTYGGIRVTLLAKLGTTRIPVQVDVGFGDAIVPIPMDVTLPALLDFPSPVLPAYAKETVIAEKFHATVILGMTNSRMKDFFDVAWLAEKFAFDEAVVGNAIRATFARRETMVPQTMPLALTEEFYRDSSKQRQWAGFIQRINLPRHDIKQLDPRNSSKLAVSEVLGASNR